MQGLEKHGVGKWREISEELLPKWDDQALRVKAARLMGTQSLARYVGWKGGWAGVKGCRCLLCCLLCCFCFFCCLE